MKVSKAYKALEEPTITDELLLIKDQNHGFVDPVAVVEYARDPKTALHNRFEWDDTEAAERYRIWQARQIIRMELVVVPVDEGKGKTVRSFISLVADRRTEADKGYRFMVDVLSDTDLREQMLDAAHRDMLIFRRKYNQLNELAKVFEAMEQVHSRKRSHG